ncbi:MAG: sigma-70 family RNA polymerase sigma factor [Kiritimatiellae bacterium]|nr:sigma-70 family RNA polymerase sigma factor [Verrucomicrobiota bacterium]MBU4290053.1 sigma-70 family RNA polymerase sigma factor [Verrucomicrobiota bacterium]MCG2679182.1 sigma-70 family RNA polymerase sigma factor [Kiritimatiellia bacterium]
MQINADWTLVEQIQAGDDRAFDALMARYKRPVINFVYRMIGDASEAEDLAQDVFVRAYQNIRKPGFHQTTGAFSTWLFQVARNAALDGLRWRKRHPARSATHSVADGPAEFPSAWEDNGQQVAVTDRSPDREIAVKEIGEQIVAVISLLPEDQKTAFILAEYQELSYAEIAAIMKCSVKSVESRLYRAKQFLRDRLRDLLE